MTLEEAIAAVDLWQDTSGDAAPALLTAARTLRQALAEAQHNLALSQDYPLGSRGHDAPCLMCGKPCNSLAGNPSLWPLRLGNNGWHHVGCVNKALDDLALAREEIARLIAPPSADVMEIAKAAIARVISPQRWINLNAGEESGFLSEAERLLARIIATERAAIARMFAEPSDELLTIAARADCDAHLGDTSSMWECGLTDQATRKEASRAVLRALADHIAAERTTQ